MKRLLAVVCIGLNMMGCRDSRTGLETEVLSTSFEMCERYFLDIHGRSSITKISKASIWLQLPTSESVFLVYGSSILQDGKIKPEVVEGKARFRELLTTINYETQDSFGVPINSRIKCKYIYQIQEKQYSPQPQNMYLTQVTDGQDKLIFAGSTQIGEFSKEDVFLDSRVNRVNAITGSRYTKRDKRLYEQIAELERNAGI